MVKVIDTVFIIQFENETSEEKLLDNDAYNTYELAEQMLLEGGYEKKLNWNDRLFYEREGQGRYANILKMNLMG
jgi:hypothetical protein